METKLSRISKNYPRQNLPYSKSSKRIESLFVHAFVNNFNTELLIKNYNKKYILAKELDLNGYGIADLVLWEYSIKNCHNESRLIRTILTTFEVKIKDWRKAIIQAYRYKYYSNRAIVIIPIEYSAKAVINKKLFSDFNIGLWIFDKKNKQTNKIFTPRAHKPINREAKEKAIDILNQKFKVLQEI